MELTDQLDDGFVTETNKVADEVENLGSEWRIKFSFILHDISEKANILSIHSLKENGFLVKFQISDEGLSATLDLTNSKVHLFSNLAVIVDIWVLG